MVENICVGSETLQTKSQAVNASVTLRSDTFEPPETAAQVPEIRAETL